ncbi:MAG: prolyl aminopeptidase [Candidatus Paracaedimonas acanthamoebae]|uniref:Proline iminopeptidase n=1 Tax=Candidatus Paracaedimonas acanthamoebae TaxID=244581 RepID=A0A8J7TTL8_9PROT|nr:prolyl aminopeptidase [Candidatus Paracaedimonas acanthamoebae]
MQTLFPPLESYDSGMLQVDEIHTLYWEQSGNPQGIPVIFLHGGPGYGSSPKSRQFFDPAYYRIIVFDQRGAGRSRPLGEMKNNTTPLLIKDMEKLRVLLDIDKWILFGGSWGSTLALAYAEDHPTRCIGLILRGIFLCRPQEINWFFNGMKNVFPEIWERFANYIPIAEREDLLAAYRKRVLDSDSEVYLPACKEYFRYELSQSMLNPTLEEIETICTDEIAAIGLARSEVHYFSNNIFLEDNQLLRDIHKIRHLPCIIVHGRYDIICPIISAFDLIKEWPEAEFNLIQLGGHSASDPEILKALMKATEKAKKWI